MLFLLLDTNDFTVTGTVSGEGQFVLNQGSLFTTVSVQHTIDGIAQEKDENYDIEVSNILNLQDFTFVGTTGTVIDTDSKLMYLHNLSDCLYQNILHI